MQNILVDKDTGDLTAIIDWECVSTLPLWRACQPTQLLQGRERAEEPRRERYSVEEEAAVAGDGEFQLDALDNEGVNSLYWVHLLEYERTQLRRLFVSEMGRLQPVWVEEFERGALRTDFETAVHNADNGFCFRIIREWLDAYECGEVRSLRERLA
ncbi:hypothetical protein AJ79_06393 [Helicocarpus griseus UAMH5409]|uniref:Aminoglycoside phosphotransferase domain-containing protein n=1 Tax=Helicocarpus griseus UAMH5409 TaxID=1447875 RepID=A0A2B7XDD4_9EURO|nr:hypothetical protein AJ79_06393 [Helicocarpus griseus UAMH5409]